MQKVGEVILLVLIFVTLSFFGLKGCEAEYANEQAKAAQWKFERENGLPYTSYSE